ncbi:MAG: Stp1/IreP family PP2C-type Ser/Thr phosphatase [Eubacteriaceae bacterium]|jgi:protein phosphatase|nr:Stp1/IreP family PP2C-type Ser/Thr phosphatase [Eubacteriaceae bacterium]
MIEVGQKSDKGRLRSNNEDSLITIPEQNVFGVADGVGGNNAGEVASSTAVRDLAQYLETHPISDCGDENELGAYLKECIDRINSDVFLLGRNDSRHKGMATTFVMCYIRDLTAYVVNVGDSRAYIRRGSELFQITEDHTYVNSLVKLGVISRDEARSHTKGNVITRAMGAEADVEADFYNTGIEDGDTILLCTDGLYGEVEDEKINEIMDNTENMDELAENLVNAANEAGGKDNITVVCLKITERRQDEQ